MRFAWRPMCAAGSVRLPARPLTPCPPADSVPALWLRDPTLGHVSFNSDVGGLLNNNLL
jgi:hypothetical protein